LVHEGNDPTGALKLDVDAKFALLKYGYIYNALEQVFFEKERDILGKSLATG
jgi:hypothetical protein